MNESSEPAGVAVDRDVGQELRDLIATAGNYGAWSGRDVLSKALMELDRLRAEVEALRVGDALHKVAVQQRDAAWREVEALRATLRMIADAFEDWQEPTPGAGREWCERFSTYLRGTVMASACFTPDEWAEVRKWMTPNAVVSGERSESA
jgi:hypothetical protein